MKLVRNVDIIPSAEEDVPDIALCPADMPNEIIFANPTKCFLTIVSIAY